MTRSFSRMVSTISHDLKTPISAIQTGTSLLANILKHEPNQAMEPVLLEMKNATKIGVSFLESLCSSATLLDAGDRELEPIYTVVCIPDVINAALGTCGLWSTKDIVLTCTGNTFVKLPLLPPSLLLPPLQPPVSHLLPLPPCTISASAAFCSWTAGRLQDC